MTSGCHSVSSPNVMMSKSWHNGSAQSTHHSVRELRQIAWRRAEQPGVSLCVAVDACPIKETNCILDLPILLRQGEPGTSQYIWHKEKDLRFI